MNWLRLVAFRPRPFAITSLWGFCPSRRGQPTATGSTQPRMRTGCASSPERARSVSRWTTSKRLWVNVIAAKRPARYMLDLIEREAAQIDQRIADLQQLKGELTTLLRNAQGLPLDDVEGKACVCHLVQNQQRVAGQDQASRLL